MFLIGHQCSAEAVLFVDTSLCFPERYLRSLTGYSRYLIGQRVLSEDGTEVKRRSSRRRCYIFRWLFRVQNHHLELFTIHFIAP